MTEEAVSVAEPSVEKLTKVYIKVRDARAELKAEFDKADAELKQQLETVKGALLDYCKKEGVDSVRTKEGMFYRTVKVRYWTNDWESMNRFIMEHEIPEFYEKRLNQTTVKQFLEENPDVLPPGLNVDSEYVVTVRKK
jgi:hypothetical protein